jgi:hypothetical protein
MPDFDIMPPPDIWKRPGPAPAKPRELIMRKLCADASSIAGGESDASVATSAVGTTSAGRATA